MNKISEYVSLLEQHGINASWNRTRGELSIRLLNNRAQVIRIVKSSGYYVFTSVVAAFKDVKKNKHDLLKNIWYINRNSDIVNFTISDENNIIGRMEFLAEYFDPAEFIYSIQQLAMQCDNYEFILTGEDRY